MAFAATTIWEVETGGDDANSGGGFDPANANFAADLAATSATGAAPVVTSASYTFTASDVGHWLFVKSGTNWTPGWYKITSVSAGAATLAAGAGAAVLYLSGPSGMSTSAGCAATASPAGGTWGVDYSQAGAARLTFTDMAVDGTTNTKFTSALNPAGPNFVGNVISVTSGTGFTVQRVQVVSVAGTTATCDKSLGTLSSAGGSGGLGGALASPGRAAGLASVTGMLVAIQSGTYTMSATANAAGGRAQVQGTSHWFGYATSRWPYNADTRPVFQPGANSVTLFDCFITSGCRFGNLDFANPAAKTACVGLYDNSSTAHLAYNIRGTGVFQTVSFLQANNTIERCEAVGNDAATATGSLEVGTNGLVRDSLVRSGAGFTGSGSARALNCVAAGNANNSHASGFHAFAECRNCVSHNTGSSGAGFTLNAGGVAHNCLATSNAGKGFVFASAGVNNRLVNCAGYNNTGGNTDPATAPPQQQTSFLALAADPFTNAAGLDFTLNATAGGGAALRSAGYPAALPGLPGVNYPDVGAYSHADPVSTDPGAANVLAGVPYTINGAAHTGTLAAGGGAAVIGSPVIGGVP